MISAVKEESRELQWYIVRGTCLAWGIREDFLKEEVSDLRFFSIKGVGLKSKPTNQTKKKKQREGVGKSVLGRKKSHVKALEREGTLW